MDVIQFIYSILWSLGLVLIGSSIFTVLGIKEMTGMQRFALAYWMGYVLFALITFVLSFMNALTPLYTLAIFSLALPALIFRRPRKKAYPHFCKKETFLMSLFAFACVLNLPTAVVGSIDLSSLTSSFIFAREMAATGSIPFKPIAFEFISPHLSQMHLAASYLIGGESLMLFNLYFMGIMAALSAYALARRRLRAVPSWIFALAVYTLPAVTFAQDTGYTELPMMGLMTSAALSLIYYARSERFSWLCVFILLSAGILSVSYLGIFAWGALFIGLLFIIKMMGWTKVTAHLFTFIVFSLLLGSHWYVWIYLQTGSTFFPYLTPVSSDLWSAAQMDYLLKVEKPMHALMETGFWHWLFSFPKEIAFGESTSIASGVLFTLALFPSLFMFLRRFPFMTWAQHVGAQELYMLLFIIYYTLWFCFGFSQDPVQLLPVLPLLLLPAFVWFLGVDAKLRLIQSRFIYLALFTVIGVQMSLIFQNNKDELAVWTKYTNKADYLQENIPSYGFARFLNDSLSSPVRVMHSIAGLGYFLKRDDFYAPVTLQQQVPLSSGTMTANVNALWKNNVTHWAFDSNPEVRANDTFFNAHHIARKMIAYGCLKKVSEFEGMRYTPTVPLLAVRRESINKELYRAEFTATTYSLYQVVPYCAG